MAIFGKKEEKQDKLRGSQALNDIVRNYLTGEKKVDPGLVKFFMGVRKRRDGAKTFEVRIFDPADAEANRIKIADYNTFDTRPDLVIWEGWFDEDSKKVELEEKNKAVWLTTFPSKEEIQQKIEAMTEPGSELSFYVNKGSGLGGPLGKGACVVELTPQVEGKKKKKYGVYFADIVNGIITNKTKAWDADKPKEIAAWIKESHDIRLY